VQLSDVAIVRVIFHSYFPKVTDKNSFFSSFRLSYFFASQYPLSYVFVLWHSFLAFMIPFALFCTFFVLCHTFSAVARTFCSLPLVSYFFCSLKYSPSRGYSHTWPIRGRAGQGMVSECRLSKQGILIFAESVRNRV